MLMFSKTTCTFILLTPLMLMPFSSDAKLIIRGSVSKSAGNGELQFLNVVPDNSSITPEEPQQLRFIDELAEYITAFPVSSLESAAILDPLLSSQIEFQIQGETGAFDFTNNDLCSPAYCSYEFGVDEALMLQGFTYPIDESGQVTSSYFWSILDSDENVLFYLDAIRQNDNLVTTRQSDNKVITVVRDNLSNVHLSPEQRDLLGVGSYKVSVTAEHTTTTGYIFKVLGFNGHEFGYATKTEEFQLNTNSSVFIETSSIYNLTMTEPQQTVDVPEPRLLFLWGGLFISLMYLGKKRNVNRF
jgi:hypothetical protein